MQLMPIDMLRSLGLCAEAFLTPLFHAQSAKSTAFASLCSLLYHNSCCFAGCFTCCFAPLMCCRPETLQPRRRLSLTSLLCCCRAFFKEPNCAQYIASSCLNPSPLSRSWCSQPRSKVQWSNRVMCGYLKSRIDMRPSCPDRVCMFWWLVISQVCIRCIDGDRCTSSIITGACKNP